MLFVMMWKINSSSSSSIDIKTETACDGWTDLQNYHTSSMIPLFATVSLSKNSVDIFSQPAEGTLS